jgi:hypothetical protein
MASGRDDLLSCFAIQASSCAHVITSSATRRGVAGIYNRATYLPEKTDALNRWAAHLNGVVCA